MNNKNGVIVLTSIITVLCLFYLSFSFISRNINGDANEFATDETGKISYDAKQSYLDSLWDKTVFNFLGNEYTLKEVKDRELNLGLDLQGGMHVILEISPVEIINVLSGNSDNPNYLEAIKLAKERQSQSQETFTDLFFAAYKEVAPSAKLAEVFANSATRGQIDFNTNDSDVMRIINAEVEGGVSRAEEVIKTRIDKFGVTQPNIQRIQGTSRIQLELPGVDNPERVRKLLSGVAKLEFLEVWSLQEVNPYLEKVNNYLVKKNKALKALNEADAPVASTEEATASEESTEEEASSDDDALFADDDAADAASTDSAQVAEADSTSTEEALENVSEIFTLLRARDALIYERKDTGRINSIFRDPNVKALMPQNMAFFWSVKAVGNNVNEGLEFYQLYVVKKGRGAKAPLTGDVIVDARQSFDQVGRADVMMSMNTEGARKWKKLTSANIGKQVAIVLDSYVYSAPVVQSEIPNGSSSITGNFTVEEAQDLANVLKAGKLPAPTRIVEEAVVGPSLGVEAQNQGLRSIIIGFVLVIVFMIAYYSTGGMVANAALLFNLFFIFGIMAQLHASLTLPGIAGIVLTIGMSIDANVLIFERIREELRAGATLMEAIKAGYQKAYFTIVDANLTTFLTGIFLYSFGTGPVKGFAVTLMVGIACSFFSAVFITRVLVEFMTKKVNESKISFKTPLSGGLLSDLNIEFLAKRKLAYVVSGVVIAVGVALISLQGLNLGVDFKGGRSYIVEFTQDVVASDLKVKLTDAFEGNGVEVKTYGSNNMVKVTTSYLVDDESAEADAKVMAALTKGVTDFSGAKYVDNKILADGEFTIPSTAKVGATIADDIASASRTSVIFSLIAIFLYITVRFRNYKFGIGAVAALFHDTLMVLSVFAIARAIGISFEIDQVFVAAMLTIIGYSINDTVVVFDRVREYINLNPKQDLAVTVNSSINSTLNRTIITSVTTLLVVLILFIFGGEVLRGFSFALLAGILFGTYSSIFIATPIMYDASKGNSPIKEARSENEAVGA